MLPREVDTLPLALPPHDLVRLSRERMRLVRGLAVPSLIESRDVHGAYCDQVGEEGVVPRDMLRET